MKKASIFLFALFVSLFANAQEFDKFPWDFPQDTKLNLKAGQWYLTCKTGYERNAGKADLTKEILIYYSYQFKEMKDGLVDGVMPSSMCIPLPEKQKAKKGDILLTWWQTGSGMCHAVVVDDSKPLTPTVNYLSTVKGEELKPNSFIVLKNGKMGPGAPIAYKGDYDKWRTGTVINIADGKVLIYGFGSKLKTAKLEDCKVLPLKPDYKVGDSVMSTFIDGFEEGYTVKEINLEKGKVTVTDKNGRDREKLIFEVVKSL